jgi:hypothetical protein
MMSEEGKTDCILFVFLLFLGLYLAYNINFVRPQSFYPKIISDKADYYVYLPATFIYGWDIDKFPPGIEKKCIGFTLNHKSHKLEDKTTCGVAILWAPFFLVTHFIAVHWNLQPDGFSDFYQKMTILPGVFYLVLGLFFLRRFLRKYFSRGISYLTVFLIFLGTNLFFYGIYDGLMSHINSFFLFSLFLFLLKKFLDSEKKSFGVFVGISFVLSLAILIRPTSALLFLIMGFLDVESAKAFWNRILLFLKPTYIITFLVIAFLVFLPQFIYWNYLSGHFMYYSYPGEGFANWKDPLIIPALFSPLNGFFIYTPLALLFIAGIFIMIVKKIPNGIFIGFFFLLAVYSFASWQCWFFGGSFGYRPLVEYYAILALPFGYFLTSLKTLRNLYFRSFLVLFILLSTYYNLRMVYNQRWNNCSTWAWDDYLIYLDEAGFYKYNYSTYTFKLDFENSSEPQSLQRECVHSPGLAGFINKEVVMNGKFMRRLDGMLHGQVKRIKASLWVNPGNKTRSGALLVFNIIDWRQNCFFSKNIRLDDFIQSRNKWTEVTATIEIPEWVNQSNLLSVYVWNNAGTPITYIDDLNLRFEKY